LLSNQNLLKINKELSLEITKFQNIPKSKKNKFLKTSVLWLILEETLQVVIQMQIFNREGTNDFLRIKNIQIKNEIFIYSSI
jgi:hypothetical protein